MRRDDRRDRFRGRIRPSIGNDIVNINIWILNGY
jgi:hypothetical protein